MGARVEEQGRALSANQVLMRRVRKFVARGEHAQGVIEFALVLTALLLIFLGTVDFSRFL